MMQSTAATSAAPVPPSPVATWNTPSGIPQAVNISVISRELSGVTSLGLRITLLPAISAGMQSPKPFTSGKFQGPITPTRPTGTWRTVRRLPATTGLPQ